MHSERFEPLIHEIKRLQNYALDRTVTGNRTEEWMARGFDVNPTYLKLFHYLAYVYITILKVLILCLVSNETNCCRLASSEAVASDVTATILLHFSPVRCYQTSRNFTMYVEGPCYKFWS
jgi:hypothetical protein